MCLCLCSFCFYHLFIWRSAGTWRQLCASIKAVAVLCYGKIRSSCIALKNKLYLEKSVMKQGIMGRQLCLFLITSVTCQPYNEVLFWAFDSKGTWTSATQEPSDVFIIVFLCFYFWWTDRANETYISKILLVYMMCTSMTNSQTLIFFSRQNIFNISATSECDTTDVVNQLSMSIVNKIKKMYIIVSDIKERWCLTVCLGFTQRSHCCHFIPSDKEQTVKTGRKKKKKQHRVILSIWCCSCAAFVPTASYWYIK